MFPVLAESQVAFESSQAGIQTENQVPFTLADLVAYTIRGQQQYVFHAAKRQCYDGCVGRGYRNSTNARFGVTWPCGPMDDWLAITFR